MISRIQYMNQFQHTFCYLLRRKTNYTISKLENGFSNMKHFQYQISSGHKTLTTNTQFQISTLKQYILAIYADPRVEDAILSYYKLNYQLRCVKYNSQRYPKFQLDLLDMACLLRRKGNEKEIAQIMQQVGKIDENLVSDPVQMQWYRIKYYNNKAFLNVKNIFEFHEYTLNCYESFQELFKFYLEDEEKVESLSFFQEEFVDRLRSDVNFFIEFALSTNDLKGAIVYGNQQFNILHKYNEYLIKTINVNQLEQKELLCLDDKEPKKVFNLKVVNTHSVQLYDAIQQVELLIQGGLKQEALNLIELGQKLVKFLEESENVNLQQIYFLKGILFFQKMHVLNITLNDLQKYSDHSHELQKIIAVAEKDNTILYDYYIHKFIYIIQSLGMNEKMVQHLKATARRTTKSTGNYNLKFARFALKYNLEIALFCAELANEKFSQFAFWQIRKIQCILILFQIQLLNKNFGDAQRLLSIIDNNQSEIICFKQAHNTVVFMKLCFELAKQVTDTTLIDIYQNISKIYKIDLKDQDLIMKFELKAEEFNRALSLVSKPDQKLDLIMMILLEFKLR